MVILKILNTNKFDLERAKNIRWTKEISEMSPDLSIDLERYGIMNFVYRSNRPFHPGRLFSFIKKFLIIQEQGQNSVNIDDDFMANGFTSDKIKSIFECI